MDAKGPPHLMPNAHCLAIAQRNQQDAPLLRLPAELRSRIYDFTMDTKTDEIIHEDHKNWDHLTFSRTSRQIFAETAQIYFEKKLLPLSNEKGISFRDPDNWVEAIEKLTPAQKSYIKFGILPGEQIDMMLDKGIAPLKWTWPGLPILGILFPSDFPSQSVNMRLLIHELQHYIGQTHIKLLDEPYESLALL